MPDLDLTAGANRLTQVIIGCDWGHLISTPDDQEPCGEQAIQRMVMHEGDGQYLFKFCERHFAMAETQTTPREMPNGG